MRTTTATAPAVRRRRTLTLAHVAVAAVLIPGLRGTVPAGRSEVEGSWA